MTKIPFFAVTAAAVPGDNSLPLPPAPPASSKDLNADFLTLISQMFGDAKTAGDGPASVETPPAPPSDKTKKKTGPDDSTAATIMAMQAPPVLPKLETPKPVPQADTGLKIAPAKDEPAVANTAPQIPEKAGKPQPVARPAKAVAPDQGTEMTDAPNIESTPAAQTTAMAAVLPPDGTGDALNKDRMKFAAEKKEIAGRATQKVPTVSLSRSPAASVITTSAIDPISSASNSKSGPGQPLVVMDWPAKPNQWNVAVTTGATAASPTTPPSAQVERVAQMVSDQAVTLRQSGANTLAVSLKVDPHTELLLQLTSHGGQIQASLRFERGSTAGLDNHWGELQQSLARQNVQLLPRDEKVAAASASASNFEQSSSHSQRQDRGLQPELPEVIAVKPVSVRTQTKTQTVSRQGWESWA